MGLSALSKFADDAKLNSAIDRKEERDAMDKKLQGSSVCQQLCRLHPLLHQQRGGKQRGGRGLCPSALPSVCSFVLLGPYLVKTVFGCHLCVSDTSPRKHGKFELCPCLGKSQFCVILR